MPVGVDRMAFTVRVRVATVEEVVIAKEVAEAFKAKLGWGMSVELAVGTPTASPVPALCG